MQLKTQEHTDIMNQFEREYRGARLDREARSQWPNGQIYQDGQTNYLFLAYRRGYALARAVFMAAPTPSTAECATTPCPTCGFDRATVTGNEPPRCIRCNCARAPEAMR